MKPPKSLDPRTLAKIQSLKLRAQHIVEGYVSGLHRSPYHGFSIEFAEHREYAPGDDLRYLDWKVYGRTDKLYLKQFEDETNLIVYVVVDTSESMQYSSSPEMLTKYEYAQCVAASLAWLVLHQQDSVGLATFDNQIRSYATPSGSTASLQQLLRILEQTTPAAKTDTGPIFHELAERLTKRGLVVIISDFFDNVDSMLAGLKHFRHRRHDILALQILDPAEMNFPFDRPTLFKGLEQYPELLADPRSLRRAYLREFEAFLAQLQRGCRSHGLEYRRLMTDQPLDIALSELLANRLARTR
ncbi:MAG: DUF58 domain-containing protein [Pirellulaceae bacterium]|jgi:uncharacterized protein (DUF58 family)|nr:DUF58 domain-containing protein [Pirellulaceae bacterium]